MNILAQTDPLPAGDWRSRLPGWRMGEPLLACTELSSSGGRVWRVTTSGGSCVYKRRVPRDFAIDGERQSALQNTAARLGLAPAQLWRDSVSGDELAEYCPGQVISGNAFTDRQFLQRLAGQIGRLHTMVIPPDWRLRTEWHFDILRHLNLRLAHTRHLLSAAALDAARGLLADAPSALRELGSEKRPLALLHLDIHAGNLLVTGEPVLLDWDYAALGDPIWDLASMAVSHPQIMSHAAEMLLAAGRAQDTTVPQWESARSLFGLLSQLWSKEHGRTPV